MSSEAEIKERTLFVLKKFKKGWLPKDVIDEVINKYGVAPTTAKNFVYDIHAEYKKSLKELSDDAANYCLGVLQGIVSDSLGDDDRTSALRALDQIQKVTKVGSDDNKVDLNVRFDFGE